jgi:ferredoxin
MANGGWCSKATPDGPRFPDNCTRSNGTPHNGTEPKTRMNTEIPFFQARIAPDGGSFDAWKTQSLLDSLEQGGLQWPSSCRSGTCRTCIGQLVSGQVHYEMAWPGLTAEEKAEGCVLPCVARPLGDVVLQDPLA